jgi:hypothetical protein
LGKIKKTAHLRRVGPLENPVDPAYHWTGATHLFFPSPKSIHSRHDGSVQSEEADDDPPLFCIVFDGRGIVGIGGWIGGTVGKNLKNSMIATRKIAARKIIFFILQPLILS